MRVLTANSMFRLLKANADIRNLWFGESISNFGDYFYDVAIAWIVFVKTGSAAQSGVLLVLAFLPQVLVGPFLGALADRLNQRRLMIGASIAQASLVFLLACLIALNLEQMWEIYGVTMVLSIAQCVYSPARSSIFPDIVRTEELMTANSLFSSSQQSTRIIGSVAGGALAAYIGPALSIGLNAFSFLAVIYFVSRIRHATRHAHNDSAGSAQTAGEKSTVWHDMKEGWQWIARQPVVLVLILMGTVSNVALGPTNVLPPIFIRQSLQGSAFSLGVFDAAIGIGILVGSLVLGTISPKRIGLCFAAGLGLQGVSMAVVSFASSIYVACIGNFILGTAVIFAGLPMSTMFQTLVPAHIRGRVNSTTSALFNIAIPLTYGGVGMMADAIGPRWCYGIGSTLLIGCMVSGLAVTGLRRLVLRSSERPQPELDISSTPAS